MPIVTCPACHKRYDPGIDDKQKAVKDAPPGLSMSMKVVCPACGQWVRLPENDPVPAPELPAQALFEMRNQSRLIDGPARRKPWWKFW